MKYLLLAPILLLLSQTASAKRIDTLFNCVTEDADQMLEVGMFKNDGPGFTAYLIDINYDRNPLKKHTDTIRGIFKKTCEAQACYTDYGYDTFRLIVNKDNSARLSLLKDGSGGLKDVPMECYSIDSEVNI